MVKEAGRFTQTCRRLRSIAATFEGARRFRQMRHAIFFAVARDAEIEIRITYLGGATDRAAMERFSGAARLDFKTFPSCRDVAPVPRLMNDLRSKENEIVNECGKERCAI